MGSDSSNFYPANLFLFYISPMKSIIISCKHWTWQDANSDTDTETEQLVRVYWHETNSLQFWHNKFVVYSFNIYLCQVFHITSTIHYSNGIRTWHEKELNIECSIYSSIQSRFNQLGVHSCTFHVYTSFKLCSSV